VLKLEVLKKMHVTFVSKNEKILSLTYPRSLVIHY